MTLTYWPMILWAYLIGSSAQYVVARDRRASRSSALGVAIFWPVLYVVVLAAGYGWARRD